MLALCRICCNVILTAAVGTDTDDWQAVVGKKSIRPLPPSAAAAAAGASNHKPLTAPANRISYGGAPEFGANFEQMVEAVQEKYQLTRLV